MEPRDLLADDAIAALEARLKHAAASRPRLRETYIRTRATFNVAETVAQLFEAVGLTEEDVAQWPDIDVRRLRAALSASQDEPPTVDFLVRLASALGYRFEVQYIPSKLVEDGIVQGGGTGLEGVPGAILIRLPKKGERRDLVAAVKLGVKRLLLVPQEPANRSTSADIAKRLESLGTGPELEIWRLLALADDTGFKLQLRFVPLSAERAEALEAWSQKNRELKVAAALRVFRSTLN